jgi:hypothetical protein
MHYANGREAKVGDPVVGRVYNTEGIIAGTLVSLTPGPDACSAQVEWIAALTSPDQRFPRMQAIDWPSRKRLTQLHGSGGPEAEFLLCRDYSHAGNLLHAEDAHAAELRKVEDRAAAAAAHV